MTIGELLRAKLSEGMTKKHMSDELAISRQTLDHWLADFTCPAPTDQQARKRLARLTERDEGYILAVLLVQQGIDPAEFADLATYAKGVYTSSHRSMVPAA